MYGGFNSHRMPSSSVSRRSTFQLSCTKAESLPSWKLRFSRCSAGTYWPCPAGNRLLQLPVKDPVKFTCPAPSQLPISRKWFHYSQRRSHVVTPLIQVKRCEPPQVLCGTMLSPPPAGPAVNELVITISGGRGGIAPSTILLPQSDQLVESCLHRRVIVQHVAEARLADEVRLHHDDRH